VEDPPGVAEEGLSVAVRLDEAVSITVPANPEMPETLIIEVPEPPGASARLDGLAAMLKSLGVTVTGTCTV